MAHPNPDLPDELGDHDCPICYETNALQGREPICPNGHTYCADCQPRIQSVRTGWGLGGAYGTACCPLCRAVIPYAPLGGPAPAPHRPPPPPIVVHHHHDGRVGDPDRPRRAVDGFNNLPERRAAQARFRQARDNGTIPANAVFGGIHARGCGGCPQERKHGHNGVRFLKMPDGKRKYRCEACYIAAYGEGAVPPPPPEWSLNGVALAAHNDQNI
jgi:hypothetical protein